MPADTWGMLKGVQTFIDTQLSVVDSNNPGGGNPFSTFAAADNTQYGSTHAIYPWNPKDFTPTYDRQCIITLPPTEEVSRHAFGGKVWDNQSVYVLAIYSNLVSAYTTFQDLVKMRDQMHYLMMQHAQLPTAPLVRAAREVYSGAGMPVGFFHDNRIGNDYDCWGFIWWLSQEYAVTGGIIS